MRKKLWKFFTLITFNLDPVCCLHSVHLIFECLQSSVTHLWWVPSTAHNMQLFKLCIDMTGPLHMPHRKLCPWGLYQKISEATKWALFSQSTFQERFCPKNFGWFYPGILVLTLAGMWYENSLPSFMEVCTVQAYWGQRYCWWCLRQRRKNLSCATAHQTFTLALTTCSITISGFLEFHTQQLCLFMCPLTWNVSLEKTRYFNYSTS